MAKQFGVAESDQAARIHGVAVAVIAIGEAPNLNTLATIGAAAVENIPAALRPVLRAADHRAADHQAVRGHGAGRLSHLPRRADDHRRARRHVAEDRQRPEFRAAKQDVYAEKALIADKQLGFPLHDRP